jgi:uncharacterized glyoxalase superfamily protein PhnB
MAAKKSKKTIRAKTKASRKTKPAAAKSRAATASLALSSATPSFTVNDLGKSVAWYRDVLGFAVEQTWDEKGKVVGVSLRAGDVSFMIGQDDWKKGRKRKKGIGFRMFCMSKGNIDALAAGIKARRGKLDQGPRDQPWGVRDISLTDPDGFKITIAVAK